MLHTVYDAPSSGSCKLQEASKQKATASPSMLRPFSRVKRLRLLRVSHDQIWCCRRPVDMFEVWVTAVAEKLCPSQGRQTHFSRNNKHVCNVSNPNSCSSLTIMWLITPMAEFLTDHRPKLKFSSHVMPAFHAFILEICDIKFRALTRSMRLVEDCSLNEVNY